MSLSSPASAAVRAEQQRGTARPVLDLIDDIQGVRTQLSTARLCDPTRCSPDPFQVPVDSAYELSPTTFWTHRLNAVLIRDAAGRVHTELANRDEIHLEQGRYSVELCSMGLKVYLTVTGGLTVHPDETRGRVIDCTEAETVWLGLRSLHMSPAATVTTTDQPRDIMRALSCLGSALKTTSCERSFPTLRGHPPLFERGERFHAPPTLERTAETASTRIEVPLTLESLYPIAPLAYYLDAVVRPGDSPRLVVDDATYDLDREERLETSAARLLKHVFTLDCITRTEGLYPIRLGERETLERRLVDRGHTEIDVGTLYNQPLSEQIQTYLSLPFEMVEDLVPRWPLTADVRPIPTYVPHLPFITASLGTIRCLPSIRQPSPTPPREEIAAFYRTSDDADGLTTDVYDPPDTESITQLWLDEGYPMRGAKPTIEAWQRRLDAHPSDAIDVAVISNSPQMRAEAEVAELYGRRDRIRFDVDVYENLSKAALSEVLMAEHDLVHYVGHVDSEGLQCADGWLDATTLDRIETRIFVLNGCRSYEQGMALIEAGAIGGLCTFRNVTNTPATRVGRTVARLLNTGFSLGSALDVVGGEFRTGRQYLIVGDPSVAITESTGGTPITVSITPPSTATADTPYQVSIHGYPSIHSPLGSLYVPNIGENNTYYLNSGAITGMSVSQEDLEDYLQRGHFPVSINGDYHWSDHVSLSDVNVS